VQEDRPNEQFWTIPLLLLWALFFVTGLFPAAVVQRLESGGWVAWERSPTTSPTVITLTFAAYLGWFAYVRCRENGLPPRAGFLRAAHVFVLGTIAFLDFPLWLLINMPDTVAGYQRYILYFIGPVKIVAWLFLYGAVLRYYGHFTKPDERVFTKMAHGGEKSSAKERAEST
jgi:hypothetical protein